MNVFGENFLKEELDNLRNFLYKAQTLGYGNETARGEIVKQGEKCNHYTESRLVIGASQPLRLNRPGESMKEYTSGVIQIDFSDGRHVVKYQEGDWSYEDSWVGGEPFSGMTTVWFRGVVFWSMIYRGRVTSGYNKEEVYPCLWTALAKVSPDRPFRGPENMSYDDGKAWYHNQWSGSLVDFNGEESITIADRGVAYKMTYQGGAVNLS